MKDLKERAIKATKLFLERRGYEVIETGWECPAGAIDVVATDDEALVFVEVSVRGVVEGGFPEGSGPKDRGRRETPPSRTWRTMRASTALSASTT